MTSRLEPHAPPSDNGQPSILHLIPSLGGGGAERQLAYLAPEMVKRGWTVYVVYLHDGPNAAALAASGVVLVKLPCSGNHDPMILWRLLRFVMRTRPQIIQTWIQQMDVFGGIVALVTRTPHIVSERASRLNYVRTWKNRLRILLGRRAAAIVANSEMGCDYWREEGVARGCSVIRNGIPIEQIRGAPAVDERALGVPEGGELIVFAGRYAPQKNVLNTMAALDTVLARRGNAVVKLFGKGELEGEMKALRAELAHGARIEILDYTTELWGVLKRARVFVSVSTFEGHPNAVLEAVVLGCPVVVSDIPEHREFLDERSAGFADPSSPAQIAEKILAVLDDPALASAKTAEARRQIEKWTVASAAAEYVRLYEKLLYAGNYAHSKQT